MRQTIIGILGLEIYIFVFWPLEESPQVEAIFVLFFFFFKLQALNVRPMFVLQDYFQQL